MIRKILNEILEFGRSRYNQMMKDHLVQLILGNQVESAIILSCLSAALSAFAVSLKLLLWCPTVKSSMNDNC